MHHDPWDALSGSISDDQVADLLKDLVSIESVNPSFGSGSGEGGLAAYVMRYLKELGVLVRFDPVLPGRPNVIAELSGGEAATPLRPEHAGKAGGSERQRPRLLLETHMDTVQVTGMQINPFGGDVRGGRLYGRGACDAKGSLAALLLCFKLLVERRLRPPCDLVLAAVVDEEQQFQGVSHLIKRKVNADAAIVGEPTNLQLVIANKGVVRLEIEVRGRAAHSSNIEEGVNAIYTMGEVIGHIRSKLLPRLEERSHPLVGKPTLCVSLIQGGAGINTVPERCVIAVDRRLIPGEEPQDVWEEIRESVERLNDELAPAQVSARPPSLKDWAMEIQPEEPVVKALGMAAFHIAGASPTVGAQYSCDASKLVRSGLPTVVFGPGDIADAHSEDESVELAQVARAAEILAGTALRFGAE